MVTLQEARAARGLSQRALAARAGVGASTVLRIERGATHPRPRVARRLAEALGVPPEQVEELRRVAARLRLPEPAIRAAAGRWPSRAGAAPAPAPAPAEPAPGPPRRDPPGDVGGEGAEAGGA